MIHSLSKNTTLKCEFTFTISRSKSIVNIPKMESLVSFYVSI